MTATSVAQTIKDVIAAELDVNPDEIDRNTVAADIDGWDSLRHVMILAALEATFSRKLSIAEITSIECVGNIIDLFEGR